MIKNDLLFLAVSLLSTSASAGTLWMTGWNSNEGHGQLHGFDAVTGELLHTYNDGYAVSDVDVCKATGTAYFLYGFALSVFVGQRYCTVWVTDLGSKHMFIIRHAGTDNQYRIATEAFDLIQSADIDDSNDDLWIAQYNGRVYRVSKKTGLRA